jgi:anthranilate synthase component 1
MDLAIAIRTGVLKDGILSVQAGAGIVFDSLPENEWKESEAKAVAILKAVEFLEKGF